MKYQIATMAAVVVLLVSYPSSSEAGECEVLPPPVCEIDDQFLGGRWTIAQLSGTYEISGTEEIAQDDDLWETYSVSGTLERSPIGGTEANYIDIACDGSITGVGQDRFMGRIDKSLVSSICSSLGGEEPYFELDVTIERSYEISGQVTGSGQIRLTRTVTEGTIEISGTRADAIDCIAGVRDVEFPGADITGATETVELMGNYDGDAGTFAPVETLIDPMPWIHAILLENGPDGPVGEMDGPRWFYFDEPVLQEQITVTPDVSGDSEPKTPIIESMELQEPRYYLIDVPVSTSLIATMDWRQAEGSRTVEFSYGGKTEVIPASGDTATFSFDAGTPATEITATAVAGSESSLPYIFKLDKVSVPGWAGSASDWQGSGGVSYMATLDWPISLETTRTISSISLVSGLWGISGSASSEFTANAVSQGTPGGGDLMTSASLKVAGKSASFSMTGNNETTLACGSLTTEGEATATAPAATWKATINPLTAIPGLQAAACGIHPSLCSVVSSFGIKGQASAQLSGSADFLGESDSIRWTGGSVSGALTASVSASVMPKPLSKVANASVYGGGTGCMTFDVAPEFFLSRVGGELGLSGRVSFLGWAANAMETIPFGDGCGGRALAPPGGATEIGWVPADGQLTMALGPGTEAAAAWSESPQAFPRPAGNIMLRRFNDGAWSDVSAITDEAVSDLAPALAFQNDGTLLMAFQRNADDLPQAVSELDEYANGYEIHYAWFDSQSNFPSEMGQLTDNDKNDFGAFLEVDENGGVHLFWQRSHGGEIYGTVEHPVSIHMRSWAGGTWGPEELVAEGLTHTFGWSPAARSENEMLIGITLDSDLDLSTAADHEIAYLRKSGGLWSGPITVTDNAISDSAPLVAFDRFGEPVLMWRSGTEVMILQGDLNGVPESAVRSADFELDEGIGSQFVSAQLASSAAGLALVWPEGVDLQASSLLSWQPPNEAWSVPAPVQPTGLAQDALATSVSGYRLRIGLASRSFVPSQQTLEEFVMPSIVEIDLLTCGAGEACDLILGDSFEQTAP